MSTRIAALGAVPSLAALLAAALAAAGGGDEREGVSLEGLRQHTRALGADAMEGRAPGTPGGEAAARYLEAELRRLGLAPGAGGEYLQQVPMHGSRVLAGSELGVETPCGARSLRPESDFLPYTAGQQTRIPRPTQLVFAGYGIVAPEYDHNDYQDLDVRDRVVVLLAGEPRSADPAFFDGERATLHASPAIKERVAIARGARGSLLIPSAYDPDWQDWEYWKQQFAFEHLTLAYALPEHLSARLSPDAARALFCGARVDLDGIHAAERDHTLAGFEMDASVRFRGRFEERDFLAPNVAGLLRGRDPDLADTAVVVSAHYDHLGIGPERDGDSIYNGVLDNAIGVAAVLEIARVLVARPEPPRRSVLFLLTTGEERGLLGSSFYVDHPLVPLHRTVAAVNVDGLSTFDSVSSFHGIGGRLSSLGETLARVGAGLGLRSVQAAPDAVRHDVYARSDQKAFAEAGVPAILVHETLETVHRDPREALVHAIRWDRDRYHTPADDLDQPIDWEAARQHAELVLGLVLAVAEDPEPPRWYPGTPFAAAQLRARAAGR